MNKNNILFKLILILQILLLVSCMDEDWIGNVKNGVFVEYDKIKPVGEVYDNWASCRSVEWSVIKESENFAEVQYKCEVKDIDKIISALNNKQKSIDEDNILKIRKLEKEVSDLKTGLQGEVCKTQLYLDKITEGYATKHNHNRNLRTYEELHSLAKKYQQLQIEAADKALNQKFADESEIKKYVDELERLNGQINFGLYLNHNLFIAGNANRLDDENNAKDKDIQTKYIACMRNIDSFIDSERNYIGDEGEIGDYRQISDYLSNQQELASYKVQRNFEDLSKIDLTVIFNVNKENFEVNKSYSEFIIGPKKENVSHSVNFIQEAIYSNVILSEELTKEKNIYDVVGIF